MRSDFIFNGRLGIALPRLDQRWEDYSAAKQAEILAEWETIRGTIPDRIAQIEETINQKQEALGEEENFEVSCRLNWEIADLASIINDLWLWYRTHQDISTRLHS
ncbi:hypothetical protein QYB97_23870 [Fictibacillus sp. NE201]|uniref:Uncharacterized protein n=1 Tax=Fictibacillus fluitans TaxID=3058422 RepID=A0ABT8I3A6_9BACL|nr:hypothetical protein [Fictibacillus sp. NE201]MDN4527521.1 hypothetical protein [Fictibacillus sp. NE201]